MSICFHNYDLLGFTYANQTLLFHGSDTKELFEKNLRRQPEDWYYRTHTITYSYNKQGHRCKNIDDIDLNNYILFVGDSNTEGMGLELETTYSYLTAKKLNCSYYNMGIGGSGLDVMFYNLQTWLTQFSKPKYVVIFLTDPARFLAKVSALNIKSQNESVFRAYGPHVDLGVARQFLLNGDNIGYFDARFMMISNMMKNLLNYQNIPFDIISVRDFKVSYLNYKLFNYYGDMQEDTVRDLTHPGIAVNNQISDYLVSQFTDKYLNARFTDST